MSDARQAQGPVYFWREFEPEYGFLSQWFGSAFEHDGKRFATTEMWMMYQKAELFGDHETAARILKSETPKEAQTIGRQVKGFNSETWNKGMVTNEVRSKLAPYLS